ncbi:phage tail sheath family protein [Xylella fastidiosa subsp. multiplex]|uniref:Phage tail sheath family protein n=3 Tax=Xylella fastidiosa TaxID=2371 RepID=A0A9Q4QSE5_XYLFS|nr:phage tail sheath family protein [Xylella fastidiosa]KAJ4851698.1 phage tail sheath family protein [Xylella fastidiosa subsp. multiplex]KAJ4853128.1 phage tail sheath family protein [Xylella fastidiosa subsp. multiplex]MBE0269768.1 phage tail sheath family protein [Xylella fastidiosa subsp. multiplex]MBE0276383.1 phage tail sheath family protein [Xylella fastidiosa subsp. multiplex]MBE0278591.1 phage tail sheath family protein [Xylella fastidiosa subsp. multiplex]
MTEHYLHGVEVLEIDDGARVIQTASSSVIGLVGTAPLADATTYPLNTPVLVPGSAAMAATLGTAGTLPQAMDSIFDQIGAAVIVVRIEDSVDETQRLSHAVGGIHAANGTYEGVHALLAAENITGYKPRLLIAPGLTHQRPEQTQANPVVSELIGIAERLRAIIIADGPGTTDAQAIAYAGDFGSKRVFLVDPPITTLGADGNTTTAYSSAAVAGLIAKIDNRNGWWWSPSNQPINGILGTSRPIDFALGDATSRANLLNEKKIATIIRHDGYRLWGNRTLSSDPKWTYLCVVRIADIIADSLQAAHLWAVDRSITKTYASDVEEGVNAYLRRLKSLGAIINGRCWADAALNTKDAITAGHVYFNFDFTPAYPAEHITFRSRLTSDYLVEVF